MSTVASSLDVEKVRADFPILDRLVNGHPLVYLDSGATSHKPQVVLDALQEHFARHNANVARSVHTVGTEATEAYEGARAKVAAFIGAVVRPAKYCVKSLRPDADRSTNSSCASA